MENQLAVRTPVSFCAWLALCFAMLALAGAVLPDWVEVWNAPPPKTITETAADAGGSVKEWASRLWRDPEPVATQAEVAPVLWQKRMQVGSVFAAVASLLLCALGFARGERERVLAAALALACAGFAYQMMLKALVAIFAAMWVLRGLRK